MSKLACVNLVEGGRSEETVRQRRVARAEHQCCCKAGACGGDQVEVRAGAPDKATLLVLERHASCESDEVQMSYEHGSTRSAAYVFFCHLIS